MLTPQSQVCCQKRRTFYYHQSPLSYHLCTNSNSHSHEKYTTHSTLPFYLLILRMRYMERISLLLHQILSIMRNIMKLRRSFITKELHPVSTISSIGKDTQQKKTLGFLKWNSPQLRNSSRTINPPSILPTPPVSACLQLDGPHP